MEVSDDINIARDIASFLVEPASFADTMYTSLFEAGFCVRHSAIVKLAIHDLYAVLVIKPVSKRISAPFNRSDIFCNIIPFIAVSVTPAT